MVSRQWRSLLATALAVTTYLSIFYIVLVTDGLPPVPGSDRGLNVTQAWVDLHVLSDRPHPYNSHANDHVHDYIISRLKPIADAHVHVHLVEDTQTNASWGGTYFEGTNILVKIDGLVPNADAVLFDAHYDSVSTSSGATDNGMAVVTLLQLIGKFARERHIRTAIFNINNGEEDGLKGAHAFLRHPWSNLTTTFLNLEGASSGGRPILFRGTSTTPLLSFASSRVPHPHGNVLAADAFAQGLIRSQTDYVVYTGGSRPMEGLDLAFYKGRSRYHTRYDAIPWLEGGERALWRMMETADGAGEALLDQGKTRPQDGLGPKPYSAVYFDLFGEMMVLFSLEKLWVFNIVFLTIIPVAIALLLVCQRLAAVSEWGTGRTKIGFYWLRFWIALLLTAGGQTVLLLVHLAFNPFIIYSRPYIFLLSALSLTYLTLSFPLATSLPQRVFRRSPESSNTTNSALLQLLIFSYLLLLAAVVLPYTPIGGFYPLTIMATCVFAGWALGIIGEIMLGRRQEEVTTQRRDEHGEEDTGEGEGEGPSRRVRFERPKPVVVEPMIGGLEALTAIAGEPVAVASERGGEGEELRGSEEPTETTPLIPGGLHRHRRQRRFLGQKMFPGLHRRTQGRGGRIIRAVFGGKMRELAREMVWLLQFLVVVPIPVIIFAHITVLLAGSLPQSITDGGPAWIAYVPHSAMAVFMLLPLAPFLPSPPILETESPEPLPPESTSTPASSSPPVTPARPEHEATPEPNSMIKPLSIVFGAVFLVTATYLSGLLGALLTGYSPRHEWIGFPFTIEDPLKVFFESSVEVGELWWDPDEVARGGIDFGVSYVNATPADDYIAARAKTYVTGVPGYVERILHGLPSAQEAIVHRKLECLGDEVREALVRCGWGVGREMFPVSGGDEEWDKDGGVGGVGEMTKGGKKTLVLGKNPWLKSTISRRGNDRIRINLRGRNTRACRVYFDNPEKITAWRVLGATNDDEGEDISEVRLWSRTWGREFVVDVDVKEGKVKGRVACEWAEYESGLVRVGVQGKLEASLEEVKRREDNGCPRIPAYEEALKFFPRWATTTKGADGLVEVWSEFEI